LLGVFPSSATGNAMPAASITSTGFTFDEDFNYDATVVVR
jgi:hypothetical protein